MHYKLVVTPLNQGPTTLCDGYLSVVPGKNLIDDFLNGGNGVAPEGNGTVTVIVSRPTDYLDTEGSTRYGTGFGPRSVIRCRGATGRPAP